MSAHKWKCLGLMAMFAAAGALAGEGDKPEPLAKGIQDNSFLVEEAYNQEAGVVQHIFNAYYSVNNIGGPDIHSWQLSFTQEWPVFGQTHQFSYTIPYNFLSGGGVSSVDGIGDVMLNYRFQALYEGEYRPAFAPRFSLILPTGDVTQGLGYNRVGYQFSLPFSKIVTDRVTLHANAGLTTFPGAGGRTPISYNLGGSAIYAVTRDFNLMLETVATWNETASAGVLSREYLQVISPGFRYAFNFTEAQMVVGLAAPIGLNRASPDYGVFIYFSFEHRFMKE
jgi:Putative MetA-pathway of phenol degradation